MKETDKLSNNREIESSIQMMIAAICVALITFLSRGPGSGDLLQTKFLDQLFA
jgi:hypothetical protein